MKQRFVIGGMGAVLAALWIVSADVAAQAQAAAGRQGEGTAQPPRRANGVPDFSGLWVPTQRRGELPDAFDPKTGNYRTTSNNRTGNPVDFERDPGIRMRMFARENKPWYKPEYLGAREFNDVHGHSQLAPDPAFQCMPAGVPGSACRRRSCKPISRWFSCTRCISAGFTSTAAHIRLRSTGSAPGSVIQ